MSKGSRNRTKDFVTYRQKYEKIFGSTKKETTMKYLSEGELERLLTVNTTLAEAEGIKRRNEALLEVVEELILDENGICFIPEATLLRLKEKYGYNVGDAYEPYCITFPLGCPHCENVSGYFQCEKCAWNNGEFKKAGYAYMGDMYCLEAEFGRIKHEHVSGDGYSCFAFTVEYS